MEPPSQPRVNDRPIITRAEARDARLTRYFTGRECPSGHVCERYTRNGGCAECRAEFTRQVRERLKVAAKALRKREQITEVNGRLVVSKSAARAAGLKRYFNGSACWRGHLDERYVRNNECVACRRLKTREWNASYYRNNRDRALADQKQYRARNLDKVRARSRAYRATHRDERIAYEKAYNRANRDKRRLSHKAWRDANPDRALANAHNRRARKRMAKGSHTAEDIRWLREKQKGRCALCGEKLGKAFDVDHIVSLSRGGTNDRRNLQITHPRCNRRKRDKDPITFAQENGRLL